MEQRVARSNIWIALYTQPHREKAIACQLRFLGMESYVPVRRVVRQWSDRKKTVEIPLLPSYVLVRLSPSEHHLVFQADGIVRVVTFHGRVAVVRQCEIDLLKRIERDDESVSITSEPFRTDEIVQIISGAFAGYRGKVVRSDGMCRVALQIEELGFAVEVKVPYSSVSRVSEEVAKAA